VRIGKRELWVPQLHNPAVEWPARKAVQAAHFHVMQENMNKYITSLRYSAVYLLGFIANFSGGCTSSPAEPDRF